MSRAPSIAVTILLSMAVFGHFVGSSADPSPRRPVPKSPIRAEPPLPSANPEGAGRLHDPKVYDGLIAIEASPKQANSVSVGTAFSINDNGLWITARHVTNGCDEIYLRGTNYKNYAVKGLIQHPQSDVSIFQANLTATPLLIDFDTPEYGMKGYHFGFPQGKPGDVHSVLMGRRVMVLKGQKNKRENVLVWAERNSYPKNDKSLGGISGGPIVNDEGAVVGIHVAGSIRRGRNYSSLPETIQYLADKGGYTYDESNDIRSIQKYLTERNFPEAGARLRSQKTVAQVVCMVR